MAEWLGTGLQNLLQRFDSAWYLKKALGFSSKGFYCLFIRLQFLIQFQAIAEGFEIAPGKV